MADFNRAMTQMLNVFRKDLGGKVTVQEISAMPRLGFLAIPGTEYSDRIFQEYYPRKETAEVIKATNFLKQVAANRLNSRAPSKQFNLSEFTQLMSEILQVFTEDCGGHVSLAELGPHMRFSMFCKTGVEQSDLLYKEFYPKRETQSLRQGIALLKEIAAKRKSGSKYSTPKRREPYTAFVAPSPTIGMPTGGAPDVSRFYSPAKPLVRNAVLDTMKPAYMGSIKTGSVAGSTMSQNAYLAVRENNLVFDYISFSMKPMGSFI